MSPYAVFCCCFFFQVDICGRSGLATYVFVFISACTGSFGVSTVRSLSAVTNYENMLVVRSCMTCTCIKIVNDCCCGICYGNGYSFLCTVCVCSQVGSTNAVDKVTTVADMCCLSFCNSCILFVPHKIGLSIECIVVIYKEGNLLCSSIICCTMRISCHYRCIGSFFISAFIRSFGASTVTEHDDVLIIRSCMTCSCVNIVNNCACSCGCSYSCGLLCTVCVSCHSGCTNTCDKVTAIVTVSCSCFFIACKLLVP